METLLAEPNAADVATRKIKMIATADLRTVTMHSSGGRVAHTRFQRASWQHNHRYRLIVKEFPTIVYYHWYMRPRPEGATSQSKIHITTMKSITTVAFMRFAPWQHATQCSGRGGVPCSR